MAGLAIQVASLVAFVALSLDFAWRVRSRKNQRNPRFANLYESRKFKIFLYSECSKVTITLNITQRHQKLNF